MNLHFQRDSVGKKVVHRMFRSTEHSDRTAGGSMINGEAEERKKERKNEKGSGGGGGTSGDF